MKVLIQSPYNRIIEVSDTLNDERLEACLRENFPQLVDYWKASDHLIGYWKLSDRHVELFKACQSNRLEYSQQVEVFDMFCDGDLNLEEFSMDELTELLEESISDKVNSNY